MNNKKNLDLQMMVPEFPIKPQNEIPRDSLIRFITDKFNENCQKQIVIGKTLTGKTNFLAQFIRHHSDKAISYFATSNPFTHDLRTYLYIIANQINLVINKDSLPSDIALEDLRSLFPSLSTRLASYSRQNNLIFFFVIDGIDYCLEGEIGSRIIDYFPLTYPQGPYALCGCRPESLIGIPSSIRTDAVIREDIGHWLEFNYSDTESYLSSLDLSSEEIKVIHEKSSGNPGYIKVIRDTLHSIGKEWLVTDELPNTIDRLISRQIDDIFKNASPEVASAIEYITVSPKPLHIDYLVGLVGDAIKSRISDLEALGIVQFDVQMENLSISPEMTKSVILKKLGNRKKRLISDLLEFIQETPTHDDLLLTLLLKEAKDYEGLVRLLAINTTVETLERTNNINDVLKRMQTAAQMALDREEIGEVLRWSRGINCA
jgi:hypothetical protein